MSDLSSAVILRMVDEMTAPARKAAAAARALAKDLERLSKVSSGAVGATRQVAEIAKTAKSAAKAVSALRADLSRPVSSGIGRASTGLEKVSREARSAAASVRQLRREMTGESSFRSRGIDRPRRVAGSSEEPRGRQLAGVAGVYAAHEAASFAREAVRTYQEFDSQRRFGAAVMGVDFGAQQALVRQAISMGGNTRFNDISVLESQRELAARGLGKDAILGMMPSAANLGTALGMGLPDAVRQLDASIFSFGKNIATVADATKSARETADAQVRAAKVSGMTPADIQAAYRIGATSAHMAGISENALLAFAGVEKRAGISGDAAGTAFRALVAAAEAPTRGAKEALLANNLDFSKYQPKLSNIPVAPFVKNVAAQYGVALSRQAVASLTRVFTDPTLLNDQAKFTPAVVSALGGTLKGKDAKSLKSIAGMANRFRNSIGGGSDVNAFLADLLMKIPNNLKLANALFGQKQGARIATALGDPEVLKALKEQIANSTGYAQRIADERMAGFDGAITRFEGATKNLETAIGRAFDAGGQGGLLTNVTSQLASVTQAFAEANPHVQRLGAEAATAATAFAGLKGAQALLDGFGLKSSAAALTGAAEALTASAGKIASGGIGEAAAGADGMARGAASKVLPALGWIGTGIATAMAGIEALGWYKDTHPDQFHRGAWGAYGQGAKGPDAFTEPYQRGAWVQNPGRNQGSSRHFMATSPLMAPMGYRAAGMGFGLGGFEGGTAMIRSITGQVAAAVPTFAAKGAQAVAAMASGIEAGSDQVKGSVLSLMSELAAIAATGITIPIRADASGVADAVRGAMNAAATGTQKRASAQFSNALHDIG